jgi:hypothetical protein
MREIADMDAYKAALNTAREAMAAALLWNKSVSAICGFMQNTNYCGSDLAQNNKRATHTHRVHRLLLQQVKV